MPLKWDLSDVSSTSRRGLRGLGKKATEVKCHCQHAASTAHAVRMSYRCPCDLPLSVLVVTAWLGQCWPRFSTVKPFCMPPVHAVLIGRKL